mmetsp:Transcript_52838/g.87536  ORF Transcript_52838/g.87536 Transcript_52838/m.87536 type:complete len:181 (-) Transcript_52838:90-632(-)
MTYAGPETEGKCNYTNSSNEAFHVDVYDQKLFNNSVGIIMLLPDNALTASASHNDNHGPQNVRLGAPKKPDKSWAWCGQKNGENYLTIDLMTTQLVTGIELASRGNDNHQNQMVTKFNVKTSLNGINWVNQGDFIGCCEPLVSVKRKLSRSVVASFVRITILESVIHPSMRVDVLVCNVK